MIKRVIASILICTQTMVFATLQMGLSDLFNFDKSDIFGEIKVDGYYDDWTKLKVYQKDVDTVLYDDISVYESDNYYYIFVTGKERMVNYVSKNEFSFAVGDYISFSYTPRYNLFSNLYTDYGFQMTIPSEAKGYGEANYYDSRMHYELVFEKNYYGQWIFDYIKEWFEIGGDSDESDYTNIYTGITVDGYFSDWNAVTKYSVSSESNGKLDKVALVWDDEYIYLYVVEGTGSLWHLCFTNYDILYLVTNSGNRIPLRPTVSGFRNSFIDMDFKAYSGDSCICKLVDNAYVYEAAIPIASLGIANGSVSLYINNDSIISGITDISGNHNAEPETPEETTGVICIDGYFSDWANMNKTSIYYNISSVNHGALFLDEQYLYGYMKQSSNYYYDLMDYCSEVDILINDSTTVRTSFVYNNNYSSNGIKLFRIVLYGYSRYTIGYGYVYDNDSSDELEYYIDLEALAYVAGFGNKNNAEKIIRTIEVTYPSLGSQSIIVCGVPTGTALGTCLVAMIAFGGYFAYYGKKKRKKAL